MTEDTADTFADDEADTAEDTADTDGEEPEMTKVLSDTIFHIKSRLPVYFQLVALVFSIFS